MQVVGEVNKLSPELLKLIQPLKPGEYVEWQRTVSHDCHELQKDNTKAKFRVYPHNEIYAKDSIYDPWGGGKDDQDNPLGSPVDIGIPDPNGIDRGKNEVKAYRKFAFERSIHGGIVVLDGKLPLHRELHEFFQLSNINSSPVQGVKYRNPEIDIQVYLVDKKKESTKKNKFFEIKKEVLLYISLMSVDAMREYAAGKNWDYLVEPDVLSAQIMEYGDKSPEQFNKDVSDPDMRKKALIKYALMENRVQFDPVQYRMVWPDGTTLATLERVKDKTEVDQFLGWLNTVSNGDKIMQQLNRKAKAVSV